MNFLIPETLETDRLILRMFKESDWKYLHKYYSDEECTRYTYGRVFSEGESWRTIAGFIGHWYIKNYDSYAFEAKDTHEVLGLAGLDYPVDWPEPEIQWRLIRKNWGKGYASEAVRAIKKMSKHYLPDLSLISLIHPENFNSINLAKSVGAHFEREHDFREIKFHIYRHV